MQIGVAKEIREGEARVATTPDSVKKLCAWNVEVVIESGAGDASSYPDEHYEKAGAKIGNRDEVFACDVVLKVACPTEEEVGAIKEGGTLVSCIDPFGEGKACIAKLAEKKASAIGMELIPRITRAQAMDILSSQANIAGYKAVLEAVHHFGKMMPMMMTAAGSVPPAKVIVLGAGVAGLQAIATAKRLGAQVEAFDVRPEVREQIESVGAKFLDLGIDESGSGEGGYAKELSEEGKQRQKVALTKAIPRADIVITTAQIPGRPAPVLVTEEAVGNMKPGSVIVDMAAGSGGNCPLSEAGKVVVKNGVTLVGYTDFPSRVACHSSQFFARNLVNLLELIIDAKAEGGPALKWDLEDPIIDGALVTHEGQVRWPKQNA